MRHPPPSKRHTFDSIAYLEKEAYDRSTNPIHHTRREIEFCSPFKFINLCVYPRADSPAIASAPFVPSHL
jgi:hypothetical protein